MNRAIQAILIADNPWLRDPGELPDWLESHLPASLIPRQIVDTAGEAWTSADRAHLSVGPRQAEKSTAIWSHLRRRFEDESIGRRRVSWMRPSELALSDLSEP